MDKFEINKIVAAIILTVVIIFGINKLADVVYKVKTPEGNTYKVSAKIDKTGAGDTTKMEGLNNIKALLTLGSVDHGKVVFKPPKLFVELLLLPLPSRFFFSCTISSNLSIEIVAAFKTNRLSISSKASFK